MKNNLSLYLNAVLIVAVGVLFWLHFSGGSKSADASKAAAKKTDSAPAKLSFTVPTKLKAAHVLYVNIDSMNVRYQALVDLQASSEATIKAYENQYQQKQNDYQTKYMEFSQKAQRGEMSEVDQKNAQTELAKIETEANNIQRLLDAAQRDALKKNGQIVKDVTLYFKDFSQEKGVDFILGYGASDAVLYANDSLDVTEEVIAALNEQYKKTKATPKK